MFQPQKNLPYFNSILKELENDASDLKKIFGHHVHWGYWQNPKEAKGTIEDFCIASEHLTRLVCDAAHIKDNMRILDVGCGFGGTIASLNNRFTGLDLVGLNIDARQLEVAKKNVIAVPGNKIQFIEGDACQLPFENNTFDAVLAVECIFHFPNRENFFKEVKRVLKKGGTLALSDFVEAKKSHFLKRSIESLVRNFMALSYGKSTHYTLQDYQALAAKTGLELMMKDDITQNTLPTYDMLYKMLPKAKSMPFGTLFSTRLIEYSSKKNQMLYMILSFR